jgi:polar amino acid transport system substrate-binding protein
MSLAVRPLNRVSLMLAALAVLVLAAAGCGSSNKSSTSSNVTAPKSSSVASEVPAKFKNKTLKIAADATYAPNEFIAPDGKTVIGMDPDLGKALGEVMGVKVQFVNATFDSIIPGLAAHKYDVGMSSFTDTKEREKTVDFVTYFAAGTSFYTKAQGGTNVSSLADVCGKKVAAEKGTTQADDVTAQNKKCKAQGKSQAQLAVFPDQNGVNLALTSGRAQVAMADSPVAEYQVKKTGGQLKLVGSPISYGRAPYGIAVPKGSGLDKPLLDALKVLISNGKYKAILTHWGIQSGAISNPTTNGATS